MSTEPQNKLLNQGLEMGKDMLEKLKNPSQYLLITLSIVFFILFALLSWVYDRLSLKQKSCNKLDIIYPGPIGKSFMISPDQVQPSIKDNYDNSLNSLLRNYNIKTAYNCCCGDGYKNNFVNMCALEKCIKVGARCLDFEIYSYNNEPIVAASTANNNSIKETYNYLNLTDVFDTINQMSCNNSETACANDPMFLHLRIMSENKTIFNKIADYIDNNLNKNPPIELGQSGYLVTDFKYNDNKPDAIFMEPIKKFSRKFIIMVSTNPNNDTLLNNTKLKNYVNIKSGSSYLKLYRYDQLVAFGKKNELVIDEVKRHMIIVLPNINNNLDNYDFILPYSNGCQFIAMKFQNYDTNLNAYNQFFKEKGGYSFILKPPNLRRDLPPPIESIEGREIVQIPTDAISGVLTGVSTQV